MAEQAKESTTKDKEQATKGTGRLRQTWYDGKNREIVVYYLIAVAFLELIVGAVAFFYGVVHAVPLEPGGPKMANFPWVGWLIAAVLSPVGLLLLLHLSGEFFSRSLNAGNGGGGVGHGGANGADSAVPERVQRFYAIMRHAPTIVILLGLIVLGGLLFFVDSALVATKDVATALMPYLPWILGSLCVFLIACYIGRLYFLSRHKRMEQEYAYRMLVFEKTGVIIASEGCTPMRLEADGRMQMIEDGESVTKALPTTTGDGQNAKEPKAESDVEDVTVEEVEEKKAK